jgi:lysozyme
VQSRSSQNSQGIDISHYQPNVDWEKVKTDGKSFAFIKATENTRTVDDCLIRHYGGAKEVGIKVGFYHFAHVSNDPIKEANHYINAVKDLTVDLWHVLDLEQGSLDGGGYDRAYVSNWARQWLEKVEEATGKLPMIYTGASFARTYFEADLSKYPLWVAHYGAIAPMSNPVWDDWTVFQYSDTGRVNGIAGGNVDLNEFCGNIEDHFKDSEADDMDKILDFEDWAWAELDAYVGDAHNDDFLEDWAWVQKVRDKQLTYGELLKLKVFIDERRRTDRKVDRSGN